MSAEIVTKRGPDMSVRRAVSKPRAKGCLSDTTHVPPGRLVLATAKSICVPGDLHDGEAVDGKATLMRLRAKYAAMVAARMGSRRDQI